MKPMEYQRVSHIHQVFETWKYVSFSLSLSLSLVENTSNEIIFQSGAILPMN